VTGAVLVIALLLVWYATRMLSRIDDRLAELVTILNSWAGYEVERRERERAAWDSLADQPREP
jgi:hypothetical protein